MRATVKPNRPTAEIHRVYLIEGHAAQPPDSARTAALRRFLARCPGAAVAAVTGDAAARLTELPGGLVDPAQPRLVAASLLDVVAPGDRKMVSKVWARARLAGAATAQVSLADGSAEKTFLSFFDLRDEHGVLAVVVAGASPDLAEPVTMDVAGADPHPGEPARVGHVWKDGAALITAVSPPIERLLGWAAGELVGRRSLELVHPDDHERAIDAWLQMLDFPGAGRPVRLRHQHRDGQWVWLEVTNHNRLTDPAHGDVVAAVLDVSAEVAAQEAARASRQLLEQVTETLPIGLFHADMDGRLVYANQRLTKMTALAAGSLLRSWPGAWTATAGEVAGALDLARSGAPADLTVEAPDGDGRGFRRVLSLSLRPLIGADGSVEGVTGAVEDVTERVAEQRALEARAATDSLTGCLNRSATLAVLQDALDSIGSEPDRPGGVALIFVDVDDFKTVNDRLGHLAGDALLVEVATRLRNAVRARDRVGRFGGDEFLVVASNVRSPEHAMNVARWIASRTLRGIVVDGVAIDVRASIGLAWSDQLGTSATALVSQADSAMYRSKRERRCQPVLG
jgi:diguanylate cyclase (GGDEF)-like protein/PAS domain S-box-containing protein